MPRYILVLRDTKTGRSLIWKDRSPLPLLRKARLHLKRNTTDWSEEAENYLLQNYRTISATELAKRLSQLLCKKVTKNAVIGRYHLLQANRPIEHVES